MLDPTTAHKIGEFNLVPEQLETRAADPFSAALLPVLMHRMNNATQLLSNLNAVLRADTSRDWMGDRSEDLAKTGEDLHDLGYLLAVLSSAAGSDLLLSRRQPRGLEIMLGAVDDLTRREEHRIASECPLPKLAPQVHGGWELPWAFGALLWSSTRELSSEEELCWQLLDQAQSWVLIGSKSPRDQFASLQPLIQERLPEGELDVREAGWSWRIPAAWLVAK